MSKSHSNALKMLRTKGDRFDDSMLVKALKELNMVPKNDPFRDEVNGLINAVNKRISSVRKLKKKLNK
jgi:hypothetical protein